ncbi:MAG: DUF1254 domain-containing protein [Terriglobales bacterium]
MSATSEKLAHDLAVEAYIYGYPLVLMDATRQVGTNVPKAGENAAPINQFGQKRSFPDDTFTTVVSPNADTLYSFGFLDLAEEPMVLSVPEMGNRYYLMQMLDAWTNVFASPGTRTTGSAKADFAIVGPQWAGTLPAGVQEVKSPTNLVWIIGRTQTNGQADYSAVHAIQDEYKLTPLSHWGKAYTPPDNVAVTTSIDMKTPPVEQAFKMDAANFFGRLNALMNDNPPAAADAEVIKRFASIGIGPGRAFDLKSVDPAAARGIDASVGDAQAQIIAEAKKPHGKIINGWEFMDNLGNYGTDYLWRAVVALVGLGANLPEDAVYPRATKDVEGQPFNGANRYEIRFAKGQLPPVAAFWSITMYNSKQFFEKNPIHRYAIGDRDKLNLNSDGSLSLYLQNQSPGKDRESNWLPAPKDTFNLFMRLYWLKKEILAGEWKPPAVVRQLADRRQVA